MVDQEPGYGNVVRVIYTCLKEMATSRADDIIDLTKDDSISSEYISK